MKCTLTSHYVGLLLLTLLSQSESLDYTKQPNPDVTVKRGENIMFNWTMQMASTEKYVQSELMFERAKDGLTKTLVTWIGSGHLVTKGYPKLKGFGPVQQGSNKVLDIAIQIDNMDYQETGVYWVETRVDTGPNRHYTFPSPRTSLTVTGKPEFCGGLPNAHIKKKEGESESINITVCGVPKPTLVFNWADGGTTNLQSSSANVSFYRDVVTLTLKSLQKSRCGRNISYYADNDQGKSAEHQIKVDVRFKPSKPQNVNAYYVSNGKGVKVTWDPQERGLCDVEYRVDFLNSSRKIVGTQSGKNIRTASLQFDSNNVTSVNVTAMTAEGTASESYQVSSAPPPTDPAPGNGGGDSDSSVWIIVGCVVGGILLIAIIVVAVIYGKRTGCGKIGPQEGGRELADPYVSAQRPNKSEYAQVGYKADQQIYADARQGVVYGELGSGGGRTGPRTAKPVESNYADIKLTAEGYPASGPTASPYGNTMISDEAIV